MAEKRMFTKKISNSDAFIELSSSAQALYFHLNQEADDDGFNNQVQNAMFKAHATIDDLKVLLAKNFIIRFESGVIVIKHWRMHNTLRKDRYTPTNFQEELSSLGLKDNGAYTLTDSVGCQVVAERLPSGCHSIDKYRLEEDSVDIIVDSDESTPRKEKKDTKVYAEIIDYLNLKAVTRYKTSSKKTQSLINARLNEGFTLDDFKTVVDKKVAEWKGTEMEQYLRPETLFGTKFEGYLNANIVKGKPKGPTNSFNNFPQRDYDFKELEKKLLAR